MKKKTLSSVDAMNLHPFVLTFACVISIVSRLFSHHREQKPPLIPGFSFVTRLEKKRQPVNYFIGIYRKNNVKYLAKSWQGRFKNMEYYQLINEYYMTTFLFHLLKRMNSISIRVPSIKKYICSPHQITIVYEYLPAKPLSTYPITLQVKVISRVIDELKQVTKILTLRDLKKLPQRRIHYYLFALPVVVALSLLRHPYLAVSILMTFFYALHHSISLKPHTLTLAHRDLTPENIILYKQKVYLLDCGMLSMTHPSYDISHLAARPYSKRLYETIAKYISQKANPFLKAYISIQFNEGFEYERRLIKKDKR